MTSSFEMRMRRWLQLREEAVGVMTSPNRRLQVRCRQWMDCQLVVIC